MKKSDCPSSGMNSTAFLVRWWEGLCSRQLLLSARSNAPRRAPMVIKKASTDLQCKFSFCFGSIGTGASAALAIPSNPFKPFPERTLAPAVSRRRYRRESSVFIDHIPLDSGFQALMPAGVLVAGRRTAH